MWFFLEGIVIAIAVTGVITQVIFPTIMGTKLFPLFRHRKLVNEIVEAREALEQERLAEVARSLRKPVNEDSKEGVTTKDD